MSPHSENNNTMKHKATFCDQLKHNTKLDAGMWRYHANGMDARRSQFDLGRVDAYGVHLAEGSNVVVLELPYFTEFLRTFWPTL